MHISDGKFRFNCMQIPNDRQYFVCFDHIKTKNNFYLVSTGRISSVYSPLYVQCDFNKIHLLAKARVRERYIREFLIDLEQINMNMNAHKIRTKKTRFCSALYNLAIQIETNINKY